MFPCCFALYFIQDLPEFFEDNMETWMTHFHNLLTLDNKLLQTDVSLLDVSHLLNNFDFLTLTSNEHIYRAKCPS